MEPLHGRSIQKFASPTTLPSHSHFRALIYRAATESQATLAMIYLLSSRAHSFCPGKLIASNPTRKSLPTCKTTIRLIRFAPQSRFGRSGNSAIAQHIPYNKQHVCKAKTKSACPCPCILYNAWSRSPLPFVEWHVRELSLPVDDPPPPMPSQFQPLPIASEVVVAPLSVLVVILPNQRAAALFQQLAHVDDALIQL
mmetsp:Transcript_65166/g.103224  ORF Transcript_65166/g.103224 Transcript_65166/m.103224 type:complete len:197 (+) Transcript_65166:28-618(+)